MDVPDELTDSLRLGAEDTHPVHFAEGLHVDEVLGGDVAVFADIGHDGHQELLLLGVQGGARDEVTKPFHGAFPVYADEGTNENRHIRTARHPGGKLLIVLLAAQFGP